MARVNGITQFLPATHTTILTLLRKHSPDGTTRTRQHTSNIAYYYNLSTSEGWKAKSWPSWLTYSGRFTHISGPPSAAGQTWDRESSPVKDQHSTTVPREWSPTSVQTGLDTVTSYFDDGSIISYHGYKYSLPSVAGFIRKSGEYYLFHPPEIYGRQGSEMVKGLKHAKMDMLRSFCPE